MYGSAISGAICRRVPYTGSWVYVKNGKEFTVNFSNETNQFRECWGDYIKSCTVQKTSTEPYVQYHNWFNFNITIGLISQFRKIRQMFLNLARSQTMRHLLASENSKRPAKFLFPRAFRG